MTNPYENLANAIIQRAAKDYMQALKQLKRFPRDKIAIAQKKDLEQFFHSGWFQILTDVDSDYLIQRMQAVVA